LKTLTIDARMLKAGGIGRYIRELIPYLKEEFKLILIVSSKDADSIDSDIDRVILDAPIYSISEQLLLPLKIPKCDIFWSPHYNIPLLPIRAKQRVVTIHDVYHLAFANMLSIPQRLYAKFLIDKALKLSDTIITSSHFSKDEIIKYTNTTRDIEVVYSGVNRDIFRVILDDNALLSVRAKYKLPEEFILFVGNLKPHKNLKRLLLAIRDRDYNLVIVGNRSNFINPDKTLSKIIEESNLQDRVYFTGSISDNDLPYIYNLSKLLVFPSLYEGFGIPPLEAQACGVIVVASDIPPLREVYKDNILYFDPLNIGSISSELNRAIDDISLKEILIEKGLKNTDTFSWQKSAKALIDIVS